MAREAPRPTLRLTPFKMWSASPPTRKDFRRSRASMNSFIPEGLHRVQTRSLPGRIHGSEEADDQAYRHHRDHVRDIHLVRQFIQEIDVAGKGIDPEEALVEGDDRCQID